MPPRIYKKRDSSHDNSMGKESAMVVKHNWLLYATSCTMIDSKSGYATGCTIFQGKECQTGGEGRVRKDHRSECVMNRMVEVFGDQWSLLVIRDIIFMNRRHFRELLTKSLEGIASNILADRLQRLVEQGIIVKSDDPSHKQKAIYSLTEKGIELLPLLMEMNAWGHKYLPASRLKGLAQVLVEGGPKLRAQFMAELREAHLRKSSAKTKSRRPTKSTQILAMQKIQAAYEAELAKRKQ
jgi:DNA-binding HxlR family transcriptional regulator